MVRTAQPRIEDAIATVEEETALLKAERRAFEDFLGRLDRIQASDVPGRTEVAGIPASRTVAPDGSNRPIVDVRTAYRETVMDVPHYEEEYGESLKANLGTEFGSELAEAVAGGGSLTPMVRDGLRAATNEAIANRSRFLAILDRERESLEACRERLDEYEAASVEIGVEIEESPGAVTGAAEELRTLHRRCERVADRRQSTIHDRSVERVSGIDGYGLVGYLYGDEASTFPVLRDCLDCLETIEYYLDRVDGANETERLPPSSGGR